MPDKVNFVVLSLKPYEHGHGSASTLGGQTYSGLEVTLCCSFKGVIKWGRCDKTVELGVVEGGLRQLLNTQCVAVMCGATDIKARRATISIG